MTSVSEITGSLQALILKVRDGFQQQLQKTPDVGASSGSSEESRLSAKRVELPSFHGDDPVG